MRRQTAGETEPPGKLPAETAPGTGGIRAARSWFYTVVMRVRKRFHTLPLVFNVTQIKLKLPNGAIWWVLVCLSVYDAWIPSSNHRRPPRAQMCAVCPAPFNQRLSVCSCV